MSERWLYWNEFKVMTVIESYLHDDSNDDPATVLAGQNFGSVALFRLIVDLYSLFDLWHNARFNLLLLEILNIILSYFNNDKHDWLYKSEWWMISYNGAREF